ncbi:hypothetical protein MBANPS3_012552, partial [Mucor bainieri]
FIQCSFQFASHTTDKCISSFQIESTSNQKQLSLEFDVEIKYPIVVIVVVRSNKLVIPSVIFLCIAVMRSTQDK